MKMGPSALARITAKFRCPQVTTPTSFRFLVRLSDRAQVISTEERQYTVCPKPGSSPSELAAGVAVYDPSGQTARALEALGIGVSRVDALEAPPGTRLLVIGEDYGKQLDLT